MSALNLPMGPVLPHKTPTIYSWEQLIPTVDISLAVSGIKETKDFSPTFNAFIEEKYRNYKILYTDGSKCSNGVGAAAIYGNIQRLATLPSAASIYTAELYALRLACNIIREQRDEDASNYLICTDSLSAVMNISHIENSNPTMSRLQILFHELAVSNFNISILWIPGHSNVRGNEQADAAAKQAALGIATLIPLPYTDFIPLIKEGSTQHWETRWQNSDSHLLKLHNKPKKWKKLNISRKQAVVLNRLRLGHTRLTHGYLMEGLPFRPPCPWCHDAVLTVEHILLRCVGVERERNFCFSTVNKPLSLSLLLGDNCTPSIIYDFLETLGIFNEI